jgi:hypothetical protein
VPTRKQKRRREKLQRHEYEYVIETETGEEIPVESPREAERAKEGDGKKAASKGPLDRRGRTVQPPSWRRVLRRSAIFAPLIGVVIYLTVPADRRSLSTIVFNIALLLAFFIPFSYMVDVFMYRMLRRREERERAAKRGG